MVNVAFGCRDRKTGDGDDESSQNRDERENFHGLEVSGKDCKSSRECDVAESARKSRGNAKGSMREAVPVFIAAPARNIVLAVDPRSTSPE